MTPSTIKTIRGSMNPQKFCDSLNEISRSLLSDPQKITTRSLRAYESDFPSNHRDVSDWVRFVILKYQKDLTN